MQKSLLQSACYKVRVRKVCITKTVSLSEYEVINLLQLKYDVRSSTTRLEQRQFAMIWYSMVYRINICYYSQKTPMSVHVQYCSITQYYSTLSCTADNSIINAIIVDYSTNKTRDLLLRLTSISILYITTLLVLTSYTIIQYTVLLNTILHHYVPSFSRLFPLSTVAKLCPNPNYFG